ncbi:MAG: hypothetical protein KKB51_05485, partial [Candidatus Riflebacteria bacterium]|nr:hypothetical protein [Candidatus Riflebacteria bacterium]
SYTFPVASLTFTPAAAQALGGTPANYVWSALADIGPLTPAGNYIATAVFFDDETPYNGTVDPSEASATFNVTLTVNATHSLIIFDPVLLTKLGIIDFGSIAQGATDTYDVSFMNTGNVALSNFSWTFSPLAHASEPTQIDAAQFSYGLSAPVAAGAYGTITVSLAIPPGQAVGNYGPSGNQTLFAATPVAVSDICAFQCEVTPSGSAFFEMASGSVFQSIATETFSSPAPDNLYFLSAWVCPGSGSADISLMQYDENGVVAATAAIRLTPDGQLVMIDSAPKIEVKHYGVTTSIPMDIAGESFNYFRIYLAFELTFDPLVASYTTINLQNSSPVLPASTSVWFDGIQLEKARPGQTRPVAFHERATIHSPTKNRAIDGKYDYYEW